MSILEQVIIYVFFMKPICKNTCKAVISKLFKQFYWVVFLQQKIR